MTVPQLILSTTASAARYGLGWFGRPLDFLSAIDGVDEVASWFVGIDHPNHPGWDYSLNGREVTPDGATLWSDHSTGGRFLSDVTLAELGPSFTLWYYGKATPAKPDTAPTEVFLSSAATGAPLTIDIGVTAQAGPDYYAVFVTNAAGTAGLDVVTLPATENTGEVYDLIVVTVQPRHLAIHRRAPGIRVSNFVELNYAGRYGSSPLTLGNNTDGSVPVTARQLAAAGAIRGILNVAQIDELHAAVRAQMGTVGSNG